MCRNLFQTLEDRSNVDDIEKNGPFRCERKDAWLGSGYYYWDSFIENAHLWGEKVYKKCNKDYVIGLSRMEFVDDAVYDLENPEHLIQFRKVVNALSETYRSKKITVAVALEQIKKSNDFIYKAIRARSMDDMKGATYRVPFKQNHSAYLDTCPHIQVCVIDKSFIGINNFKVVFPEIYCENYTI